MLKINRNLVKGSFILLMAFGLFNFFHFLFQFFMARMLSISDYGILASLFAIIYIFLIFTESVQTIITKYSAKENDKGRLKNLLKKASHKAFFVALYLFVFYIVLAIPLSFILKIDYSLLILNGLIIFIAFFVPINRGLMQGGERFKSLGLNLIIEAIGKLIFGVFLVYIGFKVYGAIIGVIFGGILAFAFSFSQLRDIIKEKEKRAETFGIYDYAKPAFIITSIIIIFYSLDVIIARIFFSPEIAGSYAIASILGKIILWGTLPISKAMFPMSADSSDGKGKENKKSKNVFMNALGILLFGIIATLVIFYLFPELIIKIFSGKIVPEAISILFYLGIAFSFIALANLVLLYKLSLGRIKGYAYLLIFIVIEIFLLSFFSGNLFQFSIAFITASAIFLWGSIVLLNE